MRLIRGVVLACLLATLVFSAATADEIQSDMKTMPESPMAAGGMRGPGMGDKAMMDPNMMRHRRAEGRHGRCIVATADGGVVVMIGNRLLKYDKNLVLRKETEIKTEAMMAGTAASRPRPPRVKSRPSGVRPSTGTAPVTKPAGIFFYDYFEDGDYVKDPAWEFVPKSGKMVIGREGDRQLVSQDWQVSQGVLYFKGNFDGLNLSSKEIEVPAGSDQLVIDFDTVLGGTWAHVNAIVLVDKSGKTVFGGGIYRDDYSRSKGTWKTNNGLVIFDETGEHRGEFPDGLIAPGTKKHVRVVFDKGVVTVNCNNGEFTYTYKVKSLRLPEIKKIAITGWQHTGGAMFDNILVHK